MIWSDNDVANDFTTLKNQDGSQVHIMIYTPCLSPSNKDHILQYMQANIYKFAKRLLF
jgi:hypothetical protein